MVALGRRHGALLALVLAAALGNLLLAPRGPAHPRTVDRAWWAHVLAISGGDAMVVSHPDGSRRRIRLIGVDAPTKRECGGPAAVARVVEFAYGEFGDSTNLVRVEPAASDGSLAFVELAAGVDLGEQQLLAGNATVDASRDFARETRYTRAQAEAQKAGRGAWRTCGGQFHRSRR